MIDSIRTRKGKARTTSMMRMNSASTQPPKKPAMVPMAVPIRKGKITPITAI